jgi:putative ATP-dependent endonuclease of OLD family
MQLSSLQVHNFRGIREFSTPIELHEYTLLVGPNNSGKSTVIDALRVFYEKGLKFDEQRDVPKGETADKESWIELEFQLLDNEHDSLPNEYQNSLKQLRVRKYLATDKKSPDGKSMAGNIYAYQPDGTLATKLFYATKNAQLGKFGNIIYIPALSSIDDEVKMTGPSALRDLVSEIVGDSLKNNPAYAALSTQVDTFAQEVNTTPNPGGLSMQQFGQDLDSELQAWNIKTVFSFAPPSPADILKSMFRMTVQDQSHGGELNVDQFGSGFQRQFIYTLIKMRAKYQRPTAKSTTKDFQPDMTLLLFEEPEAFLHPQQQELLARELRKLAKDGTFQVVCTTHSSMFVSRNTDDISSIIRLQRDWQGIVTKAQVTREIYKQIQQSNIIIYKKIDEIRNKKNGSFISHINDLQPQMEEIKYFMWLNPDRSSLFFARHVLLVEGYTEYCFINRLIADGLIPNADNGIYILECSGKLKMHAYMNILNALEISHSVLHDDDQINDDDNARKQREINVLIKENSGEFTRCIHAVERDIESFLHVSMKDVNEVNKPQHLLYKYSLSEVDGISKDRISAFCDLVNNCLVV